MPPIDTRHPLPIPICRRWWIGWKCSPCFLETYIYSNCRGLFPARDDS
jgi:hypothetical protein